MFLENKNIILKIRRSKVTDYAALTHPRPLGLGLKIKTFLSELKVSNGAKIMLHVKLERKGA